MPTANLLEDRHRTDARCQHRYDLAVPDPGERVGTAPSTRRLLLLFSPCLSRSIPAPSRTNARNRPMCSVRSAPKLGTGAALVRPFCNTEAMQLHLDEIATKVTPGAHAILILDQAGWHAAKDLKAPSNISLPTAAASLARAQSSRKHGSSCARTGCRTVSSSPSTTSSTTAAMPGTRSSTSPGKLLPLGELWVVFPKMWVLS